MYILKKYVLILGGFGLTYLGNWIYLVALNLLVLNLTNSALAVAGIFIIGPIARSLTNIIAGSIIDRTNKRNLMIVTDIFRGITVFFMPFMDSIWIIYTLLFLTNVAGCFFGPSSIFYITKYVPLEERKQFNAIMGTFRSSAFLIGPALAGILIMSIDTTWTIWINSFSFFICALAISRLPNLEANNPQTLKHINFKIIKDDLKITFSFIKTNTVFFKVFVVFQITQMLLFALDSQEVTFIKKDLSLSDTIYGFLVSIAGIGSILGGVVAATLTNKLSLRQYLGIGLFLTTTFYTAFYTSFNVLTAAISFILLGFFMAFANTGYTTFYQNNVPPEIMGRFGSIDSIFQSVIQVLFTLLLGAFAEVFTLKLAAISFGVFSILLSSYLCFVIFSERASIIIRESRGQS
ncbi:MFS transporter [Ureibacillus sp. GCM10028918]|uniref:MFS transporter n=1 Tax=Ureibacillus sp. GCM10028918 TaxID=3273429 RepID=UPI003620D8B0